MAQPKVWCRIFLRDFRHPAVFLGELLRIAYPAGRNRWQVEFHIRLQPNAEKQNWAHRLYDHARAREGVGPVGEWKWVGPVGA